MIISRLPPLPSARVLGPAAVAIARDRVEARRCELERRERERAGLREASGAFRKHLEWRAKVWG